MTARATYGLALALLDACHGGGGSGVDGAAALQCGSGTHVESDYCVADGSLFEIRALSMITATGYTMSEVRVFGTNPDGSPSHAKVVLGVDRASAGQFVSPTFVLDDLGGASNFLGCKALDGDCLGTAQLTLALASDPQTPLAHVDVQLVPPP